METLGEAGERPAEDRVGRVLSGLGPRVRRARRERGMTLEGLAAAAGTSAAHLSRLESGERQPSLDGALRLALGLGVPFSELFEEPEEPRPGTVVRGKEAPVYESGGFRIQPLVPAAGPEGITAMRVVYPADRVVDHELHEHEGQEWLYMLKGRLRLTLGTGRTVLEPGDAAFFDARLPHNFDVLSEEDAEVLMVSCVPCTHRRGSPGDRHSFEEWHRGFGESGPGGSRGGRGRYESR
ncbi:MAG: helix-turn-helix domain-containing protein [Rubrobacter sp.]